MSRGAGPAAALGALGAAGPPLPNIGGRPDEANYDGTCLTVFMVCQASSPRVSLQGGGKGLPASQFR
ncbi:hypothetical protein DUNSADRAFT_11659 [Dunaliella salina]|uniref:Encoded protein n=1 Tax=Dunaliella salina TaxID=3046 RepID=A0ABQ7GCU5_DUNSA|nr:hypothetical protein DUNSADRAFT_11659 [Dunaliella salina]|eukprot:KAF5832432.1 hypothetical protein DUNSADRAFT_11659 [Dunaliella salina]